MRMHADYRSLATLALSAYAALSFGCTPSSSIPQSPGSLAIPGAAARVNVAGFVVRPAEWDRKEWTDAAARPFGVKIGSDEHFVLEALATSVKAPSGAVYSVAFPKEEIGGKVGFSRGDLKFFERQINGPDLFGPGVSDMNGVYEKFEKRPVCLAVETVGGIAVAAPRIAELANAKDYLGKLSTEYMQKVAGDYMRHLGLIGKVTDLPPPVICDMYFAATAQPTPTPQAMSTPQPGETPQAGATPQAEQPQAGIIQQAIQQAQQKIEDAKKELDKLMQQAQQPGAAAPSVATPEPVPPTPAPTPVPTGTKTDKGNVSDYKTHQTGGALGFIVQSDTIDFKLGGLELRIVRGQRGFGDVEFDAVNALLKKAQTDGACVEVNYDMGQTPKQVTSPQALTPCQ